MAEEKKRYRVGYLTSTQDYGYAHVKLHVRWKEPGKDSMFLYSDGEEADYLSELRVQCQMHKNDGVYCEPYGMTLDFRGYMVLGLNRLEGMAKFLRQTMKKLDKIEAKYGFPSNFGVHATRVANVLGLEEIYMGDNPNIFKPRDIEGLVNHLVSKLRES